MSTVKFDIKALTPFPKLETKRLYLRNLDLTDAPTVFKQRSDPRVLKYLDRAAITELKQAEEFITQKLDLWQNNKAISWAIDLKGTTDTAIGDMALWRIIESDHRAEIGYTLLPAFWGKGYMLEAARAIVDWGFTTLGLHSIIADINPENNASRKLLHKLGFQKEGYFRENYHFDGQYLDSEIYGLLERDFRATL